jgi:hypothetical protein
MAFGSLDRREFQNAGRSEQACRLIGAWSAVVFPLVFEQPVGRAGVRADTRLTQLVEVKRLATPELMEFVCLDDPTQELLSDWEQSETEQDWEAAGIRLRAASAWVVSVPQASVWGLAIASHLD